MLLQLIEREYKELGGVCRIGWVGRTQRAWQGTQTSMVQSTKVRVYASALHILGIQLSYGHTADGFLHEHCNY